MAVRKVEEMAGKICQFCNESLAKHLEPIENGPVWGLPLEDGSDNYCSYDCWETDIQLKNKAAEAE